MANKNVAEFAPAYLQAWLDAMENVAGMPSAWHNAHMWTVSHMANVLYPLAEKLGYGGSDKYGVTVQQEYYRVDFSLYEYFGRSTWTLDYAIEHENAEFALNADESVRKKGWFDEFAKLLPIKCAGARVIIGYDTFGVEFEHKLKKCTELINCERIQPSVADSPLLLIIFPYTGYMQSKAYEKGLLRVVRFDKTGFEWKMTEFTDNICDENTIARLKEAYAKIVAAIPAK